MIRRHGPAEVLIAEDSELFAEALREVFERDSGIMVVGIAINGLEAVRLTALLRPNVVTMDVKMPLMDGLEAIETIMAQTPTPVLVLSSDERGPTGELSFEALRRGAVELRLKPTAWPVPVEQQRELCELVKFLATVPVVRHMAGHRHRGAPPTTSAPVERERRLAGLVASSELSAAERATGERQGAKVVGIVASTGGPAALASILEGLPKDFGAPVVIVQHLAPGFASTLAEWLDRVCSLRVRLAEENAVLRAGDVWVAPDGCHTLVTAGRRLHLATDSTTPLDNHRPSGSRMLESLARTVGPYAVGVVLTGMGADGASGLLEVMSAGGTTLVQDQESSVVWGMPQAAVKCKATRHVLPLTDIAVALVRCVGTTASHRGTP